ncbi:MAG TPA: hypothetical protein VM260_11945, partial [Pirellula sp.]|nr:hypothetical protein [Pirellula sp.]
MIPRACLSTFAVTAFLLIAFGVCPNCLAQKTLAWKFRKGSITKLLIEQDTNLQLENAGSAKLATNQTQQLQTTNISWIVKDLSPEGLAYIEQTIHRIQLDLKSSVGNFVVDTSNNQPLTGLGEVMANAIRPLAGSRFLVKTRPDGEV